MRRRKPSEDVVDFWLARKEIDPIHGCWITPVNTARRKYPQVNVGGKRMEYLSRLVLARKLGRPLRQLALHTCDVPACVNPAHLYEGDQFRNMADMIERGRMADTRGEANGRSKLTRAAVLKIRAARGRVSQQSLADNYGVTDVLISLIQLGKVWRHV